MNTHMSLLTRMSRLSRGSARRVAFTLTELLVVISILILILAMAIPAFSSMLYSSALATAQNSLSVAIAGARDAAVRSAYGQDAAAVFIYTPNGRLSVIPCVEAGTLMDVDMYGDAVLREVFVPASGVEPVQLPNSWAVSGYAAINSIDAPGNDPLAVDSGWYLNDDESWNYEYNKGNWVFPETGFFGPDEDMGRNRQTFMIRFQGGTGAVETANLDAVLVVLPSTSMKSGFRNADPWRSNRLDIAADLERAVERIVAGDADNNGVVEPADDTARRKLLGDVASDTVLVRPVPQVALYNLRKAASAAGASGLSATTGSLYYTDPSGVPRYDPRIFGGAPNAAQITQRVNEWIQGQLQVNGKPVASDAIVYSFQRYLGTPQELIPPEAP